MKTLGTEKLCEAIRPNLNSVIANAVRASEPEVRALYAERVREFRGGHRSIRSVDLGQITRKLLKDCGALPHYASTILRLWYTGQADLRDAVKNLLRELDYTVHEPDFGSHTLVSRLFHKEHVETEGTVSYFGCHGRIPGDYSKFDVTLMAALLGWYPVALGDDVEETTSNGFPPVTAQAEAPEEPPKERAPVDIENDLRAATSRYSTYCGHREECSQLLLDLGQGVRRDSYRDGLEHASTMFAQLRMTAESIASDLQQVRTHLPGGGPSVADGNDLETILRGSWQCFLASRVADCREKVNNFPEVVRAEILKRILECEATVGKGTDPADWQDDATRVSTLLVWIKDQAIRLSVRNACQRCMQEITPENLGLLFSALSLHMGPVDHLSLVWLFGELAVPISAAEASTVIQNLSLLSTESHREYLSALLGSGIQSTLADAPEGGLFFSLLALLLWYRGNSEGAMAGLYFNDNAATLDPFPSLRQIANCITSGGEVEIYESDTSSDDQSEATLVELFQQRQGRYVNVDQRLQAGVDNKYRAFVIQRIYPRLHRIHGSIGRADLQTLEAIRAELSSASFSDSVLMAARKEESSLPSNHTYEKRVKKFIAETAEALMAHARAQVVRLQRAEGKSVRKEDLAADVAALGQKVPTVRDTVQAVFAECVSRPRAVAASPGGVAPPSIYGLILRSGCLNKLAPQLSLAVVNGEPSIAQLRDLFLEEADENRSAADSLKVLLDGRATLPARAIATLQTIDTTACDATREDALREISALREQIISRGGVVPSTVSLLESEERWPLIMEVLRNEIAGLDAAAKRSSNDTLELLKSLEKRALQLKLRLVDEGDHFPQATARAMYDGLAIVEQIAVERRAQHLQLGMDMVREIEHLWNFRGDPLDELFSFIRAFQQDDGADRIQLTGFTEMSLEEILPLVRENQFGELGLSRAQWDQISGDRRDDIIDVLESWIFLREKATGREAVLRDTHARNEIEDHLKTLTGRIAKICSLYRTNDQNRIGQDPHDEWNGELPYVFCTRIQNPRCEALNQQIRMYVISRAQLANKAVIRNVSDYISDRGYAGNSFSMFVVLGDRAKFDGLNTYSMTRHLPVLDEAALKRIIFSSTTNRPPKWEFVSLITLNSKISTIQPFKTQGSVTSEYGIFVGRADIIKEMTSSRKDYAVYGGRRIGKSSLLSEVKRQLEAKGCRTAYQSLQGTNDPVLIARGIIRQLARGDLPQAELDHAGSLEECALFLRDLYNQHPEQDVAVFLDEVDEMIIRDRELGRDRHQIIEIFRDIAHETGHRWRFIFAGFKEMYLEIHGKGVYEQRRNPWENFVDEYKQLSELESPRELINEGLRDILGLEFDKEVADLIETYSTGHPAFLQKFCQCLVNAIDRRVSPGERKIYRADVDRVFQTDNEFIGYVWETIDLNLSDVQKALVYIAAHERLERFTERQIVDKLHEYLRLLDGHRAIRDDLIRLQLDLLLITGVLKRATRGDEYAFSHPHYVQALVEIERVDRDAVERALARVNRQLEKSE